MHPAKLATDLVFWMVSQYFFWNHRLAIGLCLHLVPPIIASYVVMRYADLRAIERSDLGRHLKNYMTPVFEGVRLFGDVVTVLGAWYHKPWLIGLGVLMIAIAWLNGKVAKPRGGSPGRGEHPSPTRLRGDEGDEAMPASPWRSLQPADPHREYLVLLSFLPLKRLWRVPSFLIQTSRIVRQLEHAPGLIGYSLNARLLTGRFWTLSVWDAESALQTFVNAAPHAETMRALMPHMGPTRFVRWTILGAHLPVRWDDALRR